MAVLGGGAFFDGRGTPLQQAHSPTQVPPSGNSFSAHIMHVPYKGTSLIRKCRTLGPSYDLKRSPTVGSWEEAASYERGTPIPACFTQQVTRQDTPTQVAPCGKAFSVNITERGCVSFFPHASCPNPLNPSPTPKCG